VYFTYTGIRVTNLRRSLEFYKKVMGMKVILRGKMRHGGVFVHLKSARSPQRLELNWYPRNSRYFTKYRNGEEMDHLAFWSLNVQDDFEQLVGKRAESAVEPFREGYYELAFVKDPDGIWIELLGKFRVSKTKKMRNSK
jgi:lactoylglutathione lyase